MSMRQGERTFYIGVPSIGFFPRDCVLNGSAYRFLASVSVSLLLFTSASAADCVDTAHCICLSGTVRCAGLSALELPAAPMAHTLLLQHCRLPLLNADQLRHLPQLRHLRVVNCSVQHVAGRWQQSLLSDIDLSDNSFAEFRLQWLDGLPQLRSLNLSGNPLRSISGQPAVERRLLSLELSGSHWNCTDHSLTWLAYWLRRQGGKQLVAADGARCGHATRKEYQTMDGRRLLDVMKLTATMLEQCPSSAPFGCSCDLIQVEGQRDGTAPLTAVLVEVYCDNRELDRLPPILPDNTVNLYIRNNSLASLGPVIGNQSGYQSLTGLYLDGNMLESEDANRLEGSDFINRFSVLSLSRNRLQTLPLYAFDNAFTQKTSNVDSMFLGDNPWLCSCDSPFTFTFQTWLVSHNKLIRDRSEIRCGAGPLARGPPPGPAVIGLSRRDLCGRLQVNWWDVAIGLLATTGALMTAKFVYDLTVYRRTGKLPLIARKFPC